MIPLKYRILNFYNYLLFHCLIAPWHFIKGRQKVGEIRQISPKRYVRKYE